MFSVDEFVIEMQRINESFKQLKRRNNMQGYEYKTTIHSNQFMIIRMHKDTKRFVVLDGIFGTYAGALHKAQDQAGADSYNKYIVVAVAAIAEGVENPAVVTQYKL